MDSIIKNKKSLWNHCINDSIGRWYAGRDSLHYGVGVVEPPPSKCPPDICILWFESLPKKQKRVIPDGITRFWYAGRDSNPQPSEPESDALSIEPPAHFSKLNHYSRLCRFCKEENKIFF